MCSVLQLLGDFVPKPPIGALPMDPTGGLPSLRTSRLDPQLAKQTYAPASNEVCIRSQLAGCSRVCSPSR